MGGVCTEFMQRMERNTKGRKFFNHSLCGKLSCQRATNTAMNSFLGNKCWVLVSNLEIWQWLPGAELWVYPYERLGYCLWCQEGQERSPWQPEAKTMAHIPWNKQEEWATHSTNREWQALHRGWLCRAQWNRSITTLGEHCVNTIKLLCRGVEAESQN